MTMEQGGPHLVRDDDLTRELAAIYAAPAGAAYWRALEERIVANVAADDGVDAWWAVPEKWLRMDLLAAGFALMVAGGLLLRTHTQVSHMVYESVVESTFDAPTLAAREDLADLTEQQAVLRALTGR